MLTGRWSPEFREPKTTRRVASNSSNVELSASWVGRSLRTTRKRDDVMKRDVDLQRDDSRASLLTLLKALPISLQQDSRKTA